VTAPECALPFRQGRRKGGRKVNGRLGAKAHQRKAPAFAAELEPVVGDLPRRRLSLRQMTAELARRALRRRVVASDRRAQCAVAGGGVLSRCRCQRVQSPQACEAAPLMGPIARLASTFCSFLRVSSR
jgi:hypothetical protein